MKIDAIDAVALELPQRDPYVMSRAEYRALRVVVARVRSDEGASGIGQASITAPLYNRYGETPAGAVHVIEDVLAPALRGDDPRALEQVHARMDRAIQANPTAKTAVDLALHDLVGRALGVPVHLLLGGAGRSRLPVLWSLSYAEPDLLAARAREAVGRGFRALKLRVGRGLAEDVASLRAVRDAVGPDVRLSADFNQGLHYVVGRPEDAIGYAKKLEAFDLDSIEQPCAAWDLQGMARLAGALDTPLIADESVWDVHDARRVIDLGAADAIKIKIMKPGGLWPARKIAAVCEAAGMPVVVGHGIAGAVQNAAELHFAATLGNLRGPGEMVGFLKLTGDVVRTPLELADGELTVPSGPGLGVEVDETAFTCFRLR